MPSSTVVRGGDVKVWINGNLFTPVSSVKYRINTNRKEIFGIDQIIPFELAPGTISIDGSVDVYRMKNNGSLEGRGIVAPLQKMLEEKYFSLVITDRETDICLLYIPQASLKEQNWSFQKGICTGSFSFAGIGYASDYDF